MRGYLRRLRKRRASQKRIEEQCRVTSEQEALKKPARYTVIDWLLTQTHQRRYMEIGVRNPEDCFGHINADYKVSVDPGYESSDNRADVKLTSDEFFEQFRSGRLTLPHQQFDVIFIDGLHLADQVWKDIQNALQILAPVGYIVLHDCNPPTRYHARESIEEQSPARNFWNGTTWKAFQRFRVESSKNSYVVNSDWGVGVIENHRNAAGGCLNPALNPFYEFATFERNRQQILNLVDFEELCRPSNDM